MRVRLAFVSDDARTKRSAWYSAQVLAKNTSARAGFGFAGKWLIAVYPKRPLNSLREPIPVHCFRSAWDDSKRKLRDGCWQAIIRSRAENVNFSAKTRPPVTIRVGLAPIDCPYRSSHRRIDVSFYDFLDRYLIVSLDRIYAHFSLSFVILVAWLCTNSESGIARALFRDFQEETLTCSREETEIDRSILSEKLLDIDGTLLERMRLCISPLHLLA